MTRFVDNVAFVTRASSGTGCATTVSIGREGTAVAAAGIADDGIPVVMS